MWSLPLDHQGSPSASFLKLPAWVVVMKPGVQKTSLFTLFLSMGTSVVPNVGLRWSSAHHSLLLPHPHLTPSSLWGFCTLVPGAPPHPAQCFILRRRWGLPQPSSPRSVPLQHHQEPLANTLGSLFLHPVASGALGLAPAPWSTLTRSSLARLYF